MTIHQVKVQKINHTQFVDDHDRFSGPESSYPRWYRGSFLATNDWDTQSCVIRTPTNLTRSGAMTMTSFFRSTRSIPALIPLMIQLLPTPAFPKTSKRNCWPLDSPSEWSFRANASDKTLSTTSRCLKLRGISSQTNLIREAPVGL